MQLNKVLKEKQPSMKREIFAKSSHFIEGVFERYPGLEGMHSRRRKGCDTRGCKENPCSNLGVSKSEHGFNLSEYITIQYFIKCRSEEPVDEGF